MSKVQILRALINQRLTAAAEEIFVLFERTIAEYEEELCLSKEKNKRQQKLLDAVLNPQLQLHRADVQQLVESKEEFPPEQQERSSSLDQEDPEPPHIKEEQEELWTSQEGEQLQGLEEADITKFTFTPVPVKTEDDEEKPQSSQLHPTLTEHMETEADGGSEPDRNSHPDRLLHPDTDDKTLNSSETETGDSDDEWTETSKPQSSKLHPTLTETEADGGSEPDRNSLPDTHLQPDTDDKTLNSSETETETETNDTTYCWVEIRKQPDLNTLNNNIVPINDMRCNTGTKSHSCSECGKRFVQKRTLQRHVRKVHRREKPSTCSVCNGHFKRKCTLKQHMRIHTGEKPFSCSVCDKRFIRRGNLNSHMKVHTKVKPFRCSVCEKGFTRQSQVKNHKCVVESSSSSL